MPNYIDKLVIYVKRLAHAAYGQVLTDWLIDYVQEYEVALVARSV